MTDTEKLREALKVLRRVKVIVHNYSSAPGKVQSIRSLLYEHKALIES